MYAYTFLATCVLVHGSDKVHYNDPNYGIFLRDGHQWLDSPEEDSPDREDAFGFIPESGDFDSDDENRLGLGFLPDESNIFGFIPNEAVGFIPNDPTLGAAQAPDPNGFTPTAQAPDHNGFTPTAQAPDHNGFTPTARAPDHNGFTPTRLGMIAPQTGGLGEPCEGLSCDPGLHCKITVHDASYTTGTCVREHQHAGGEGQRCRTVEEGSPCDPGLTCNRVRLLPQGYTQICQSDHSEHPGAQGERCRSVQEGSPCDSGLVCNHAHRCEPAQPERGENGGRCNRAPLDPCNADNLRPQYVRMYPSGYSCTCHLFLGEGHGDSEKLGVGALPPHMGNWNEPCRNTFPECNFGLYCKKTHSWTATFGTCQYINPPHPSPTPQPAPQPNRGGEGQQCRNGSPQCDFGLDAVTTWENLPGQALQYPVCRCWLPLGNKLGVSGVSTPALGTKGQGCRNGEDGQPPCDEDLFCLKTKDGKAIMGVCTPKPKDHGGDQQPCYPAPLSPCDKDLESAMKEGKCMCSKLLDTKADADDTKLGMPAPDLGAEGNGCRNGSDGRPPCNFGLYCDRWTDGSAFYGTCRRFPHPTPPPIPHSNCGGVGEKCCSGSWCMNGLDAVTNWEHLPGQAMEYPVCRCEQMVGAAPGPQ